jgi:hypothetical protein
MKSLLQAANQLMGAAAIHPVEESAVSRPASEGSCGRSALAATPVGHVVHFSASDICNGLLCYACNN